MGFNTTAEFDQVSRHICVYTRSLYPGISSCPRCIRNWTHSGQAMEMTTGGTRIEADQGQQGSHLYRALYRSTQTQAGDAPL